MANIGVLGGMKLTMAAMLSLLSDERRIAFHLLFCKAVVIFQCAFALLQVLATEAGPDEVFYYCRSGLIYQAHESPPSIDLYLSTFCSSFRPEVSIASTFAGLNGSISKPYFSLYHAFIRSL